MHQYILKTPESSTSMQKYLGTTTTSIRDDQCPYCLMKKKFNIGSTGDQKCFQHTIKAAMGVEKSQGSSIDDGHNGYLSGEEMVQILEDVEESLDYYWENLREVSGGNPHQVHKDLEPVLSCVKRVQEKIGRFFFQNPNDVSEIKPTSTYTTVHKKFYNSGSQRHLKVDLSNLFDPQQTTATESIKQWVMHFHKILQMRQPPEQQDPLSYESDLQMRIFKQSMERKFMEYTEKIQHYEQKIKDILTKLIFYMEKSSESVPEKQIEEDILFIEGQHVCVESRQSELERLLLMQASSMEYILYGSNT